MKKPTKLPAEIVRLRRVIDAAHAALRTAVVMRLRAASRIGEIKATLGLAGLDFRREAAMRRKILQGLKGAERDAVAQVFDAVLSAGRDAVLSHHRRLSQAPSAPRAGVVRRGSASTRR